MTGYDGYMALMRLTVHFAWIVEHWFVHDWNLKGFETGSKSILQKIPLS